MLWNQNIDPTKDPSQKPFVLWRPFITAWEWLVPPTVAHRDRQSPLARYVAAGVAITVCLALLAVGVLFARPMRKKYKDMRAQSMVKEARQMAENGQVVNAVMKAQEAYTNAPESEDAIRLNFEYFTMMKRDTALYFYDKLKNMGSLTPNDEQLHVKCLMNLGKPKDAALALDKIMREQKSSDSLMKLAEEVWGGSDQNKPLIAAMHSYTDSHPDDKEGALRLAKLQVTSTNPTESGQGMETLWKLAAQDDALGLQTLEFINSLPTLTPEDTERLIERLKKHPKGDERHYVTALKREVLLNPRRKKEIVMAATVRYQNKKRDQLVPFIRWLVEEGEFRQVLTVLPEDEAKTHQGLLENYLNALTMLQRYSDVERLVEDPKVANVLDPATMAMFRAHLAYILKRPSEELRSKLIAAKDAAQMNGRYPALLQLAKYGEDRGHFDIAEEAYRQAIKAVRRASAPPVIERDAFVGLINSCTANRDTEALIQACQDANARWPDNSSFAETQLYVNVLAGRNIELSLRNASALLKIQPTDNQRKLIVALAQWRLRDKQQAVQNLQYIDLNPLTEGQRAVFAAIANSGGFHNEAMGVIKDIKPQARMLPEEQRCYESVVNSEATP
ncbi:hypothetical protein [Prosthecobacter vanneervenii]|uniref:Tetratricopeptide (TPR) repeat protein n=1 Tax=Prosthecobacter vanneervenii TaxID=48466 RepID=A0A7W8DIT4_9BACT|nr:hypothetical protein [Prosthecobacter vanneervenii]MBB5031367.1 tetratricopeptide (TPR) repeat protein [Prosthecobacter vanneervenii]